MTGPVFHHDRALVPGHLTAQTIETAEFDVPFYIEPGDDEDYDGPVIFVSPDDELLMAKEEKIDRADAYPGELMGKVAIMRIALMDTKNYTIRDAYIADLRFLGDGQLSKASPGQIDGESQGEFMQMADLLADTVRFDAFIAAEPEAEFDIDEPNVAGAFYGNPELYPALRRLRKAGNEALARFMEREAKPNVKADFKKAAEDSTATIKAKEKAPDSDPTAQS